MGIEDSIDLIIDTYNSFWEERSFYKYTLETTLYSFLGDGKENIESYYDYAKKINNKTTEITQEELEIRRRQAQELQLEIEEGGWISE